MSSSLIRYVFEIFLRLTVSRVLLDGKGCRVIRFISLNCLRLQFNYRHFEDDMSPFIYKEEGFKHLDRVIDIVPHPLLMFSSRYSVLDMDQSYFVFGWEYVCDGF